MKTEEVSTAQNSQRYQRWLMVLLTGSVLLNVVLSYKTFQLSRRVRFLSAVIQQSNVKNQAQVGAWVPPLEVMDPSGKITVLSYSSSVSPTVLYAFSPDCGWCKRNLTSVRALAEQTANRYRFVGLSIGKDMTNYGDQHEVNFPVYVAASQANLSLYKLERTPHTLVISPDGYIVKSWQGAYIGDTTRQLRDFFGVEIPAADQPANAPKAEVPHK
ncbi:MAG TPA: TlpA disulfide reductase family protein [Pyrinomonadaceae bacterium]